MAYIRTKEFIDWENFLSRECKDVTLTLDFEIDAGFSFTQAVALRKMKKTGLLVTIDHTLRVPATVINFEKPIESSNSFISKVTLRTDDNKLSEVTDRYFISIEFSPKNINYSNLKAEIERREEVSKNCSRDTILMSFLSDYFLKISNNIKHDVLSLIEMHGFFARYTFSTLNLYIKSHQKYLRIVQSGGGQETAWNNPIHPLAINEGGIKKSLAISRKIPDDIKKHIRKGVHYKFLGFYDESFLCYYKVIECIYKNGKFSKKISKEIFGIEDDKLAGTIKNSNQKIMMLFIFQLLTQSKSESDNDHLFDKELLMQNILEASEVRNSIAHSSDKTEDSRRLLPFIIELSAYMVESIIQ